MGRGIALLFLGPRHSRWVWGISPTPRPPLAPGKTRHPLYRRLGGPQGRSGRAENLVPTGIRSWTVQPVAQSLYRLSYRAHIILYNSLVFAVSVSQGFPIILRIHFTLRIPATCMAKSKHLFLQLYTKTVFVPE